MIGYFAIVGVFIGNTAYEANSFVGAMAALYVPPSFHPLHLPMMNATPNACVDIFCAMYILYKRGACNGVAKFVLSFMNLLILMLQTGKVRALRGRGLVPGDPLHSPWGRDVAGVAVRQH